MTGNKSRKLALAALVVMIFYLVVSIVLYVCLEAVDEDEESNSTTGVGNAVNYVGKGNNLHSRLSRNHNLALVRGDSPDKALLKVVPKEGSTRRDGIGVGGQHHRPGPLRNSAAAAGDSASTTEVSARAEFEKRFPPDDMNRIRASIQALRVPSPETQPGVPYDIYNCPPDGPPPGYPMTWKLSKQILKDWNPKDTNIPRQIYHGLCVFDWDRDARAAETYRRAEVPFVVQNHPEVLRASERWNEPGYLQRMVGKTPQRTEHSSTAHLMYWKNHAGDKPPPGWKPPSENIDMTVDEFLDRAIDMERHKDDQLDREHWYFRLNGAYGGRNSYLYDELPIFMAGDKPSFYMVDPRQARGINCRLGMRGNIAETHYDSSINWIVVMGGQRRYILAHPNQCKNMELYHFGHPSARHSSVDWTNPPDDDTRPFANAMASEVVLQPGDSLYLPDSYLHFIVSLNINYQCNARSGMTLDARSLVQECELDVPVVDH